jgi:hypothetical protein
LQYADFHNFNCAWYGNVVKPDSSVKCTQLLKRALHWTAKESPEKILGTTKSSGLGAHAHCK